MSLIFWVILLVLNTYFAVNETLGQYTWFSYVGAASSLLCVVLEIVKLRKDNE